MSPILRIGVYSLCVNLSLVGIKLTLSFLAGSLALRADAIHSLVDVFASIALIIGLLIAGRRSRSFPYGLYKVENLVSVIISILLFMTAYEIVREAISSDAGEGSYSGWVLAVVGGLILVPFFFSRYEIRQGRKFNSPSITADGTQFKADVLSSSVVFFALIAEGFGLPLDRIAAGLISMFVVKAGWDLLSNSMRVLLDASVDQSVITTVQSILRSEPTIVTVENVTGRNSGRYVFIEASITLRIDDLERAHDLSEQLSTEIKEHVPNVDRVSIHYEPHPKTEFRYGVPISKDRATIADHFGEAPYFAIIDIDTKHKSIVAQQIFENPLQKTTESRGIKVAEWLMESKPDIILTRENLHGKGPGYVFADYGVKNEMIETKSLQELTVMLTQPSSTFSSDEPQQDNKDHSTHK